MNYVKYTYVDSVTGVSVACEPATNGPVIPNIAGLQFEFAIESEYPTSTPIMYGSCLGEPIETPGAMAVMTRAELDKIKDDEMAARAARSRREALASIADRRWRAETAGIELYGHRIETDRTAVAMVTGAALAASLDPSYSARWKTTDGFVTLSSAQILEVAQAIRAHVQACFDREADLIDALNAGTYDAEMLESGWPGD